LDDRGEVFFIDIGPRPGGNFLPQIIQHQSGCDLTACALRIAMGLPVDPVSYANSPLGFFSTWIVHSLRSGRFRSLAISPEVGPNLIEMDLWTSEGQEVSRFGSSKDALGCALLSFTSHKEMEEKLARMNGLLAPEVSSEEDC
jgi:hypothetical protein